MRISLNVAIDVFWILEHALSKELAALILYYLSSKLLGQLKKATQGFTVNIALTSFNYQNYYIKC